MFTLNLFTEPSTEFKTGDCFTIYRKQPYVNSKVLYDGKAEDFYEPFPASITYSLASGSSAATVVRASGEELKVTLTDPATNVNLRINSIKNPYSQLQDLDITVKHKAGCGNTPTACNPANCLT